MKASKLWLITRKGAHALTAGLGCFCIHVEGQDVVKCLGQTGAYLSSGTTLSWIRTVAQADANSVLIGKISVTADDPEGKLSYIPVQACLGTGGLACGFPWVRLGLKSGIIRVFQIERLADGGVRVRRTFQSGVPVDAVFIGDPFKIGVVVVTSKELSAKDRQIIGWPNVRWNGDIGVWEYSGHPR
jgi:hypothetical protein